MAKTLLDLANSLEQRAAKLDSEACRVAVSTAETILGDLVYKTPVDTSQALSNWQVSLGSPIDNKIPPYFPGEGGSMRWTSYIPQIEKMPVLIRPRIYKLLRSL